MDHIWLRESFGGKLSFYGGVFTQTVLPHGMPDVVRLAVAACVGNLAHDGTALLLAPSHRMMTGHPAGQRRGARGCVSHTRTCIIGLIN